MAALVVLGFLLRTTNAVDVFVGDSVVFAGNDPYYQAHRVFQALAAYPWVPLIDPLLDHPHGAAPIWPPVFAWLLASLAKFLGLTEPGAIETMLALSVPALGAVLCVPVYGVARRILDGPGAWLAAALAVLIPAHLWYSRLGFVDHHAAVTLVQVAMFLAALVAVRSGRALWLAVTITFGMALWNGFILFVAVLDVFLGLSFALGDEEGRRRVARAAAWAHAWAAVLILPLAIATVIATGAPWGAHALSLLHVGALAVAALIATGAAIAPQRAWVWLAAAIGFGLVGGLASGGLGEVAGWIFARDDFMSSIQEVVPIFLRSDGALDLSGPTIWLTRFWFVVPILLVVVARGAKVGRCLDEGRLLLAVWGTALFVLTLRQRRFAEAFAPVLAILVAFGLRGLQAWLIAAFESRIRSNFAARAISAAVVAAIVLYGLGPYYEPVVRNPTRLLAIAHAAEPSSGAREVPVSQRNLVRLGRLAADDRREGGVMNLWPLGHRILYLAGLPVAASPFGTHVGGSSFDDATSFFLERDEDAAVEILESRRLRYVVVDNDLGTVGAAVLARGERTEGYYRKTLLPSGDQQIEYQPGLHATLYGRLALLAGAGRQGGATALHHFRLMIDAERDHHPGHPKVFERVAGAQLRLRGRPETTYELRYEFVSDAGRNRAVAFEIRTDVKGDGALVLPYSSERPDVGHVGRWRIGGPEVVRELFVPEDAVVQGRPVHVDLRSSVLF